jgi:hypothetical protein
MPKILLHFNELFVIPNRARFFIESKRDVMSLKKNKGGYRCIVVVLFGCLVGFRNIGAATYNTSSRAMLKNAILETFIGIIKVKNKIDGVYSTWLQAGIGNKKEIDVYKEGYSFKNSDLTAVEKTWLVNFLNAEKAAFSNGVIDEESLRNNLSKKIYGTGRRKSSADDLVIDATIKIANGFGRELRGYAHPLFTQLNLAITRGLFFSEIGQIKVHQRERYWMDMAYRDVKNDIFTAQIISLKGGMKLYASKILELSVLAGGNYVPSVFGTEDFLTSRITGFTVGAHSRWRIYKGFYLGGLFTYAGGFHLDSINYKLKQAYQDGLEKISILELQPFESKYNSSSFGYQLGGGYEFNIGEFLRWNPQLHFKFIHSSFTRGRILNQEFSPVSFSFPYLNPAMDFGFSFAEGCVLDVEIGVNLALAKKDAGIMIGNPDKETNIEVNVGILLANNYRINANFINKGYLGKSYLGIGGSVAF